MAKTTKKTSKTGSITKVKSKKVSAHHNRAKTSPRGKQVAKTRMVTVTSPVDPSAKLVIAAELADDSIIESEIMGEILPHFVYRFEQEGKPVVGLTVKGVNEVVRRMNKDKKSGVRIHINPQYCKVERDVEYNGEKGVEVSVFAENLVDGNSAWGIKFEPYKKSGKRGSYNNAFAVEKAMSKAERNAKRKLIPETLATKMIEKLITESPNNVRQLAAPAAYESRTMYTQNHQETPIEELQNMVREGIRKAKTGSVVHRLMQRTMESDKFDSAFKEEISQMASVRIDVLDEKE